MSAGKKIIPAVLGGAIGLSWLGLVMNGIKQNQEYQQCLVSAQESYDKGLYEQSVEYYKEALTYREDKSIYQKIVEVDQVYYDEEHIPRVCQKYVDDLMEAAQKDPGNSSYWLRSIELYREENDYKMAYKTAKKAFSELPDDQQIQDVYNELRYMTRVEYRKYVQYSSGLNDFISLYDGDQWYIADDTGKITSRDTYDYIGFLDEEGRGFFRNDIDVRFLDIHEITRARFDIDIKEAGCYSPTTGYTPVLVNNVWRYLDQEGQFLEDSFEAAGCFVNGKAAVKKGGKWYLINDKGEKVSEEYEEIGLDLYGSYIQERVILAKKDNAWHIYDMDFNQISDFACEEMDICLKDGKIAFRQGKSWGFVDTKGNVMIEPAYRMAKSFSNGKAAVSNGKEWGFINENNELIIPYQFADAGYFNDRGYCIISMEKGSFQFMHMMFE